MELRLGWIALLLAGLLLAGCDDDESAATSTGAGGSGAAAGAGGGGGAGGAGGGQSVACQQLSDNAQAALQQSYESSDRKGGTVAAMITNDCGLWTGAAGDAHHQVPLTADHLMRIGSVTKTYLAAVVLQLAAEGALGLDDKLEGYVAGVPNGDTINIRQLLNHTAGVYNYTLDTAFIQQAGLNPAAAVTPQQIVDVAIAHGPSFAPGEDWEYSNTGYILLGMIVETVTGKKVGAVMRSRLLDAHGLSTTFFDGEEQLVGELATGYALGGQDVTHVMHPSVLWTAGAMVATVADAARWGDALYDKREVLAEAQMTEMLNTVDTSGDAEYGLGVLVIGFPGIPGDAVGHNGIIAGYNAEVFYFKVFDATIATVVNNLDATATEATAALAEVLYDRFEQ